MDITNLSHSIKQHAIELGFNGIAFAKAEFMDIEARRLEDWLHKGLHGEMSYMENHFDIRVDPTKLVPGAKSVISLMYNYYNDALQDDPNAPKISMYAYGRDYHKVIRKKLKELFSFMTSLVGHINGRVFVDSAPILERDWAKRSGLGWIGKHTLMLTPQKGSYFFLAEIICDVELIYDLPIKDHCGTCTRCIEACPTDAISKDGYLLDSSRCISYLTIERKGGIPEEFKDYMDNYMYGCDICQQVCPWNRFSTQHKEVEFLPKEEIISYTKTQWQEITKEVFDIIFEGSPIKRTKFEGLKRNIDFLE